MNPRISRILDALLIHMDRRYPSGANSARDTAGGPEHQSQDTGHVPESHPVTPAALWNHPLPDPFPGAAPKPAQQLLAWAATHAAFARAEAAGARAAVAELAKQFTATDFDDEELISRMQQAVRATMAEILRADVPTQTRAGRLQD
jgi:hypothetical protein